MSFKVTVDLTCDNCGSQEQIVAERFTFRTADGWWTLEKESREYDLCSVKCVSQFIPPTEVK